MPTKSLSIAMLIFVGVATAAVVFFWVRPGESWSLPAFLPKNVDQLEPEVSALIREKAARIDEAKPDAAAHGELGLVYEANAMWPDAEESFSRAVQLDPRDRLWRLHLTIAMREAGDFQNALNALRSLAAEQPSFAAVHQRLGAALLETGELADAAAAFERVVQLEPQRSAGYVGLADVRLQRNDAAGAVPLLERAIQLDPDYGVAHHLLGTAYRLSGRDEEAARELARGSRAEVRYLPDELTPRIERYTVNVKARIKKGVRLLAAGKAQPATEVFEPVLRSEPNNVTVMNNLAGAYVRIGRLDDARALLLRAAETDDRKYTTYVNLASWAVMKGQLDRALDYADGAVQRAPLNDVTHLTRCQILSRLGRTEDALASAERAAQLNQANARSHILCAELYLRLRRYEDANRRYRRILVLDPQRVDAWLGLCQANVGLGRMAEAKSASAKVRQLAPDDARVKRLVEELSP